MMPSFAKRLVLFVCLLAAGAALAQGYWSREGEISTDLESYAEFAFTRIIFDYGYQPLPGPGNDPWRDWPDSDMHFIRGIRRLTSVDVEDQSRAIKLKLASWSVPKRCQEKYSMLCTKKFFCDFAPSFNFSR